jgi:transposase
MLPNEKEKEGLIIDLLNKGHKTREIAKLAHVSNTTVIRIRAKQPRGVNEEQQQSDQNKKQLSVPSQAFKLFLEGKPVVRVAIELDLPTDQALKIHSDYLILQNMGKASRVLMEHRKDLRIFGFA